MLWEDGNVSVYHARERWRPGEPTEILVHCWNNTLRGTDPKLPQRPTLQAAHRAAKLEFDAGAALDIVDRCIRETIIDDLANLVFQSGRVPYVVFPHIAFDDDETAGAQEPIRQLPTNALPFAYARYLGDVLGCELDEAIIQIARVGRTALTNWLRFLYQPAFSGDVDPDNPYIIVDDVVGTGGGLAALRSYIVRNGGTVIGATVLANASGQNQQFGIAEQTVHVLKSRYGDGLSEFWLGAIGHEINCLTEREGELLVRWGRDRHERDGIRAGAELLQFLRTRINQAAATHR
jgi:hypothetical protein